MSIGVPGNNPYVITAGAFTDNYTLNVPWTTDPGAYSATVAYTVVQY